MTLAVTLTVEQLRDLMRDVVRSELAGLEHQTEVLTTEEAAQLLRLHPKSVIRYAEKHNLPMHEMGGSEKRFRRSELLTWLANNSKG